jgi:hypothetical protein
MPLLELILLEKVTKFKIFFFHIQNNEVIKNIIKKKLKLLSVITFNRQKVIQGFHLDTK